MAKYLITTTETYRVDSEEAVEAILEEAKNDSNYTLVKYRLRNNCYIVRYPYRF